MKHEQENNRDEMMLGNETKINSCGTTNEIAPCKSKPKVRSKKKIGCLIALCTPIALVILVILIVCVIGTIGDIRRMRDVFVFKYIEQEDAYHITGVFGSKDYSHLEIPATYKGKKVTEITGIGEDCPSLESIEIPNTVTCIGSSAFEGCAKLTAVQLPSGIKEIGGQAFMGCSKLTSVRLPDGIEEIGQEAFAHCESLTELVIPSSVKQIGDGIVSFCPSLSVLKIDKDGNEKYISSNNCIFEISTSNRDPQKILVAGCKTSVIPNDFDVAEIGGYAFFGCVELSEIEIPNTVTSIGNSAFAYCYKLENISFSNGIKELGERCFYKCISLEEVRLPSEIERIEQKGIFAYCSNLTTVYIPSNLSFIANGSLFMGCTSLNNYVVSPDNLGFYSAEGCLLTRDGGLLSGNNDGIMPMDGRVKSIAAYAFAGRTNCVNVVLPKDVDNIQDNVFEACTNLKSIVISAPEFYIGGEVFKDCDGLEHIFVFASKPQGTWHDEVILKKQIVYFKDEWHYVDGMPTLK